MAYRPLTQINKAQPVAQQPQPPVSLTDAIDEGIDIVNEPERTRNYTVENAPAVGRALKADVVSGVGDLVSGFGNAAEFAGLDITAKNVQPVGERLIENNKDEAGKLGLASDVTRALPFTVATIPLGIGAGKLAATGAKALGAGVTVQAGAGLAGAGISTATFEGLTEAGNAYAEALKQGKSEEEAKRIGKEVLAKNIALLSGTNALQFGAAFLPKYARILAPKLTKSLDKLSGATKLGANLLLQSVTEGAEETAQSNITRSAFEEETDWNPLSEQNKREFTTGVAIGGLFGGAGAVTSRLQGKSIIDQIDSAQKPVQATEQAVIETPILSMIDRIDTAQKPASVEQNVSITDQIDEAAIQQPQTESVFSPNTLDPDISDIMQSRKSKNTTVLPPVQQPTIQMPQPSVIPSEPVTPVTRKEVKQFIEDTFLPLRTGRLTNSRALGEYNMKTDVARTRKAFDFPTAMHELGHFLDIKLDLRDAAYDAELLANGQKTSAKDYTTLQVRLEGTAEFMRQYMVEPETAKQNFPTYSVAFEQKMKQYPEIKQQVDQMRELVQRWYTQSAIDQGIGTISFEGKDNSPKTILQRARDVKNRLEEALIDDKVGIQRLVEYVEKTTGNKVSIENDPYISAIVMPGTMERAKLLIEESDSKKVVEALRKNGYNLPHEVTLKPILESVQGQYAEFVNYAIAKHMLDVYKAKGSYVAMPLPAKQYRQIVVDTAKTFPHLVEAQQQLTKYNENLLKILLDGGVITDQLYNELRTKYPNYVPLFREFDEQGDGKFFSSGGGFGNVAKPIKTLKGSARDIIDVVESIAKNTYKYVGIVERNRVAQQIVDLAKQPGLGQVLEAVPGTPDSKDSTFGVWVQGKRLTFKTTPELYQAIQMLNKEANNIIIKLFSYPTSILRAGATGANPEFIIKNMVRDSVSAAVFSRYGFTPVVDTLKGVAAVLKKDQLYYDYKASGAGMSALVSVDRDSMQDSIQKLMKTQGKLSPKAWLDVMRDLSEASEMSTRIVEYRKTIAAGKSQKEAAYNARDVTLDFNRAGSAGRKANQVIAFFNASVQGVNKTYREFKNDYSSGKQFFADVWNKEKSITEAFQKNPIPITTRAIMAITVPSLILYMLNKDDDRYKAKMQWEKDSYWFILTENNMVRIPKPPLIGQLFGSSVERFLDYAKNKDPKVLERFAKTLYDQIQPSFLPTALGPLYEWYTNYSLFRQAPIVPLSEQGLPPSLQYDLFSSELAKFIGGLTSSLSPDKQLSPRKIDNLVRGYTAGLGSLVNMGVDYTVNSARKAQGKETVDRPELRISEYPGIRSFTSTPYRSSQYVQDFYDKFQEQEQLKKQYKLTGKRPEGYNYVLHEKYKAVNKELSGINKKQREILDSSKLDGKQKRTRLDALNRQESNIARRALGRT